MYMFSWCVILFEGFSKCQYTSVQTNSTLTTEMAAIFMQQKYNNRLSKCFREIYMKKFETVMHMSLLNYNVCVCVYFYYGLCD